MPLGFERINERTQRPNALINFIKPLSGATSAYAQDFLERIAAISYPIMKANHIAVMALEEYPPNPEFVGRNFNAGEVIQLVLKDRGGRWLPFRHVQLVMMHELAHCKQMNHSKDFWEVRDAYAAELRDLWRRNYSGDGFWGKGKTVLQKEYEVQGDGLLDMPESLCGGTYGTRRRKRRRGAGKEKSEQLSYAERKQRRILKKFGAGGTTLGDDGVKREELERGKAVKGKPRVAGSARGRELRAAAALARFENVKKEETEEVKFKQEEDSDSDNWSGYEDIDCFENEAVDLNGKKLTDADGHGMVKICEGENEADDNAQREMAELYATDGKPKLRKRPSTDVAPKPTIKASLPMADTITTNELSKSGLETAYPLPKDGLSKKGSEKPSEETLRPKGKNTLSTAEQRATLDCPVCSLVNELGSLTCIACANVLNTQLLQNHWRCQTASCRGGAYINSGDTRLCGLCGLARST